MSSDDESTNGSWKQIVKETQREQDLSREVISLKEERDALKQECEKFKSFQKTAEEFRQELNYEKDINANLRLQLQKTQDSNAQLILAVQDLEDMLKQNNNGAKKSGSSDSWATISELGYYYIESLQEEIEKQAQGFEEAKVEPLHEKAKWKNATNTTAERLLEEFKRVSVQMASTFVANEKASMKALAEASELRLWKTTLEEMLKKANEEIQLVRDEYEAKLCDLSNQLIAKTNHVEQMMLEINVKSNELEHQRKHEEDVGRDLSKEILGLKVENERLAEVNTILSEKTEETEKLRDEMKQMKASIDEAEMLARGQGRGRGRGRGGRDVERNELLCTIALAWKEAENSQEEVKQMKSIRVEKEREIEDLRSELNTLKSQCNDLEHSLFEEKTEKEKLRNQAFKLKGNIKKKEDAFNKSKRRAANSDAAKITSRNNKSSPVSNGTKEVANLREKIKSLEGQIKLKENALETSTNSFLEKEMDLLNKIEELGSRVNELCDYEVQKGAKDLVGVSWNDATNNRDCDFNELLTELVSLKERNGTMESELKEMQERYSEISLKFAQVEGERQQLVITVRNLKNSMKN